MYIRKLQPCILSENMRPNSKLSGVPDYSTPPYLLHSLSPLRQGLVIYSLSNRQHRNFRNRTVEGIRTIICIMNR